MINTNEKMKIDISVYGKFHAFWLAGQLNRYGLLRTLYTVYPKYMIKPSGIPSSRIKSIKSTGAAAYICHYLNIKKRLDPMITNIFDKIVSINLNRPNKDPWIFHGWNGFCERSVTKVKNLGGICIVERSCPHIEFQLNLLAEEMSLLHGKVYAIEKTKIHERMLREYELADYIFVPSTYSSKSFVKMGFDTSKVKKIPLCPGKLISYKERVEATNKEFIVLFIGGNFYRKGLFYLLKAWNKLKLKNVKLIIKGDVPKDFKYLVNQENMLLINYRLSDKALIELYNRASILCLPSIDDGFGMVVLEAMSAGLPVVITENVGAKDLIQNGIHGFIVRIRDVEALKEKILYLYENPEICKAMGQSAKERVSKGFTWDDYGERVIAEFHNILNEKSLSPRKQ